MSLFDRNLNIFKALKPTYTRKRIGYLGRYASDGSLDPDPRSGLPDDYVWVRFDDDRGATRVKNLMVRAEWGVPVWVEFNELTREDEVREVHSILAPQVYGGALAAALNLPSIPAGVSTPVTATDIQALAVRPDADVGGLTVRILSGWAHGVRHDGSEQLTLVPTATSGQAAFACVGIETGGDLVQTLSADRAPTFPFFANGDLTKTGAADIQAVMDADPTTQWLWAFLLDNGDTTLDLTQQADLRMFNPPKTASAGSLTSYQDQLGSDVTVASSAWSDLLSRSLSAGTWLITASACGADTTYASHFICRFYDGSTTYASGQATSSAGTYAAQVSLTAVITLSGTTTIKLQGSTTTGGTTSSFRAATPNVGSGNNATTMTCVKIA